MLYTLIIVVVTTILILRYITSKRTNSVGCLVGKTAIVTGGNSGIGYATATLLASRGCRVIIADKDDAEESRDNIIKHTGNPNIFAKFLDLSSLKKIREFAEDIKRNEQKIDILINNAGIAGTAVITTVDGLNTIMQVNYFGAFLLTHLLIGPLKAAKSARVIFTASPLAFTHNLRVDNLNEREEGQGFLLHYYRYCNSKLCNILAAQEFGKKLKKHGITANSVDPWMVRTRINSTKSSLPNYRLWMYFLDITSVFLIAKGKFIGAQTPFHLASEIEMEGKTSGHYFLCRPWFKPSILNNDKLCRKIWEESEKLVNLSPEEKLM